MARDPQHSRATPETLTDLHRRFGSNYFDSLAIRDQHCETWGPLTMSRPDAVIFVESRDDVVDAVRICASAGCPIIPYGTGTSVEGHISAEQGGITIDFSRMDKILEVNAEDFDCRVQPGVTRERLNSELRDLGLFFPVDPGANASLGGMAGTGASGTTTVRYGAMRQNVIGMEIVLANGEVVRTGGRYRKSAAGYDLTNLLVGSEGTLGLTTELTLRLHPIPQAIVAATCAFPTTDDAVRTATEILQFGIPIARMELVDLSSIKAVNNYSHLGLPEGEYLFLEFRGSEAAVQDDVANVKEIAARHRSIAFTPAEGHEAINQMWKARHDAALAGLAMIPNSQMFTTDLCVPISRLAECIEETKADVRDADLLAMFAGHVGDGNFHTAFIFPKQDPDVVDRIHRVHDVMVKRALSMGGTCTGEHGIGIGKQHYLRMERGTSVDMMRTIKTALDPNNILNPGKIFEMNFS